MSDIEPISTVSAEPDSTWSVEKLKPRIIEEHNLLESFSRKSAVHTYRLGRLLKLAQAKTEYGKWHVFLVTLGISDATDSRAQKLFDSLESEGELAGLTITEGYEKAGISLGKKSKPESKPEGSPDVPKTSMGAAPPANTSSVVASADDDDDHEAQDENGVDSDEASGDTPIEDDEFTVVDRVAMALEYIASDLELLVTDDLPKVGGNDREAIRLAIQKVTCAHDKLLEAFFNGTEAV